MKIDILTIFPEMFGGVINSSITKRAVEKGILEFNIHNIRDFSLNKHKNTDDYPFGGGPGMVMMAQPIMDAIESIEGYESARKIYLSPRGRVLSTEVAKELSKDEHLILLCGHYEGIDERVMTLIDEEISIGDYILTGGELPAMVLIDCVSRFIDGVLGCEESAQDESFGDGLLEYPQYTRPSEYRGMKVPEVLLNGNHALIAKWRREQSLLKTLEMRPELIDKCELTKSDKKFLDDISKSKEK